MAHSFHITMLLGKLRQAFCWANNREGGGGRQPGGVFPKTKLPVAEVLQDNHPGMHVPPVENPTCMAFEEY